MATVRFGARAEGTGKGNNRISSDVDRSWPSHQIFGKMITPGTLQDRHQRHPERRRQGLSAWGLTRAPDA